MGDINGQYHDVIEGGFVKRPTLNDVEKGLLGFLRGHSEERLVVECHHFGADER